MATYETFKKNSDFSCAEMLYFVECFIDRRLGLISKLNVEALYEFFNTCTGIR